ncbi:sodium-dependent neutral amino acid transporter B(0)AT2 [Erpetoichthys calabaricus]|uniref:sodium-dependent neutral amino acid transporter B(0)AT2 n=1 Tax=Erpetoichthys calabaricus TaxID=27687 RepID=UPI00223476F5|nr:sodium-dependent neutral amino acid transporter B(0)AT2 [Erpetoichthys calabaricus]XP_051790105.1 sodium-dependent neutral amino acid transporter B(0)AT2 [Erpetoichthys calabaricus]XP_051790106.1 sodium-dependent neutral amino acid transporter B(0)AT2 [Erpetoichthys calabaricus]
MEKSRCPVEEGDGLGLAESSTGLIADTSDGTLPVYDAPSTRPTWGNKMQYILAQVGFSVGLGNVWRFPYLCHQNGGGAFLLLYFLLLVIIGIPLFFLELAAGQSIRQGSIGVWKHISPRLAGIGFASCVVCSFVALYYNVIIAWSLFYLGNSFQYSLPWESCPSMANSSNLVPECTQSSPTTYFWYRQALDITDSIEDTGSFNPIMIGCLFAAWVIVCLAMIKGIKSSGKVMYFSSVFPYVVLFCFLVRGLLLEGAADGIRYMFYPRLQIWGDVQVWRQAATQVFFALGLGFGSVIAYSSYNSHNNNCHFDAILVSFINFMTSVLASLVVFAVLGFRANVIVKDCVEKNLEHFSMLMKMGSINISQVITPNVSATVQEYQLWYEQHQDVLKGIPLERCSLEKEMNKGVEGTGLAFIAFTEAMSLFPASPFWSVLFFLMLLNLGLSTMFGNMQGILTPLIDNFSALRRRRTLLTVLSCLLGFLIGLLFVQRCGSYFVTMFDDYSATLPLIIVVVFETISVSWVYGAERFIDDIEGMLAWRPPVVYKYLWKYICLIGMVGLLLASLIQMCIQHPTYRAWNVSQAEEVTLQYPPWGMVVLIGLILLASLPIPALFIRQLVREYVGWPDADPTQTSHNYYAEVYTKCSTDPDTAQIAEQAAEEMDEATRENGFFVRENEEYKLLPQEEGTDGQAEFPWTATTGL